MILMRIELVEQQQVILLYKRAEVWRGREGRGVNRGREREKEREREEGREGGREEGREGGRERENNEIKYTIIY